MQLLREARAPRARKRTCCSSSIGIRQIDVIIEVGVEMRAPVHVGRQQSPVAPQVAADEVERARGGGCELRARQRARGDRQAADHERVPRGEDLLIARRAHALRADREQLRARARRCSAATSGGVRPQPRGDLLAREPPRADASGPRSSAADRARSAARTRRTPRALSAAAHLLAIPDVELALVAFRVGVEARVDSRPARDCISRSTQAAVSRATRA